MPHLYCPDCFQYSFFKEDQIDETIACPNCGHDLYKHYYEGRRREETNELIRSESKRISSRKNTTKQAARPAVRERFQESELKRRDGIGLFKWALIGWQFLMIAWLFSAVGEMPNNPSDAYTAGMVLALIYIVLPVWLAGSVILGLLHLVMRK